MVYCLSRSGCQIKYIFIYLPFQAKLHVKNVIRKYEETHGDSTLSLCDYINFLLMAVHFPYLGMPTCIPRFQARGTDSSEVCG